MTAVYDFDAMRLDVAMARKSIDTPALLERAFIWERTPQGRDFWSRQATGLDFEGRSTLAFMIAQSIQLEIHSSMFRGAA